MRYPNQAKQVESDAQFHWNDALINGEEKTMEIAK